MQPNRGASDGSAFRDFLRLTWRRKWLIVAPLVVFPCAAGIYSQTQDHLYQASAEVLLSRDNPVVKLTRRPDPAASIQPDRIVETQAQLARVPAVTLGVLPAAGVKGRTHKQFLDRSSVVAKPNSDLLEFRVRDTGPATAKRLATEYARQFTGYRRGLYEGILADTAAELEQRIGNLKRAGRKKSLLAVNLRERLRRVETLAALQTSDAILVHRADEATQVQPRPARLIGAALALGLLGGLALAFMRDALDTRVRTGSEIGERLGLPLLARIAKPSRGIRRGTPGLVMLADPDGREAEPYRALRASIELALLASPARSLMVTSAVDSEGKSTTVANLAVAFARSGRRVLLVDLDLQRPMLATLFGLSVSPGVAEVATGAAPLESVIVPVAVAEADHAGVERALNGHPRRVGSLGVVVAGSKALDVGELAGGGEIAELLDALERRADLVLVDAPPLLAGGEALATSAHVDALLAIARLRVARAPMLDDVHAALEASPARLLGFVLTGAEREEGYSAHYYVRSGRSGRSRQKLVA